MKNKRYSKDFGKKEKVLNYACQTYQLSRPNKVGAVMALIRECQPKSIAESDPELDLAGVFIRHLCCIESIDLGSGYPR